LNRASVFHLTSHPSLATLPSFKDGWFYVQDPSTLLAVLELDPKPGETILDACAAPGGKTAFIAQLMENRGVIIAEDTDPARLALVRENCTRLGVTCVQTALAGADIGSPSSILHPPSSPSLSFDRILVDAPCSNTGVMRRRVDLRWRVRAEEIERLRRAQLDLLHRVATRLKPGGTLVYSTCSLEPEENGSVVRQFLARHPAFKLASERELLPFTDGTDGAYVAKLTST
jgi:16S rRNA (cytosine967-C5)-methyltransferase